MPGNQIQLTLQVNADTQQAKRELNSLKAQLDKIAATKTSKIIDSEGMVNNLGRASVAAKELRTMLQQATDVNTGQLNLSKFALSLKNSGKNIQDLEAQLRTLGPEGARAAQQLSSSITNAQAPVLQLNGVAEKLLTTFKNTGRYLLSTAIFRAVSSGAREAIQYIQDLNKSLTDIRIVTGYSIDQMAQFASQANNAAKALSTTTNEYAKASLIFFQQGLTGDAVQERTDTTIKMANVTGQSAQQVSDQMTAVWNNFAKGGENLESYADKMVALGAATASSSSEIATGLEKFAAIADTVGLSFDYASAALATVTATTRQSADTVGTAFKTLFARLESLKLGDTLEDGTDLTKYSQALLAVGVNVKDANGELKNMDTIIDETMSKWQTLNKDQQMALAQTVAGMRQYTQFIALMDSADFFKENLATARGAEGTLQEQADIYAESWEAAKKRVTAAAEGIYDSLLDDQFFIKITNGFGKFLEVIDNIISGLGGLKTLLPGIISLVFTLFNQKISTSLLAGFNTLTGAGKRAAEELRTKQNEKMANQFESEKANLGRPLDLIDDEGASRKILEDSLKEEKNLRQQIADTYHLMTPEQQKIVDGNLQLIQNAKDELQIEEEKLKALKEEEEIAIQKKDEALQGWGGNSDLYKSLKRDETQILDKGQKIDTSQAFQTKAIKQYQQALKEADNDIKKVKDANTQLISSLKTENSQWQQVNTTIKNNVNQLGLANGTIDTNSKAYRELYNQFLDLGLSGTDLNKVLGEIAKAFQEANNAGDATINQIAILEAALKRLAQTGKASGESLNDMHLEQQMAAQAFTSLTSGVTSAFAALNSFKNLGNIWSDETLSGGEKLFQSLSSIAFAVPMVMNSVKSFSNGGTKLAEYLNTVNSQAGHSVGTFSQLAGKLSTFSKGSKAAELSAKGMGAGTEVASKGLITMGGSLGAVAAYAAAAVAIIAILAAGIYVIVKAVNAEKEAIQSSTKSYEEAKARAAETKEKYEELKTSIEELKKAQEDFAKAKTPEEAKKFLDDMNEKAKKLIETYKLFDHYTIEDGQIVIDDEGYEQAENEARHLSSQQEIDQYGASTVVNQLDLSSQANEVIKQIGRAVGLVEQNRTSAIIQKTGTNEYITQGEYFNLSEKERQNYTVTKFQGVTNDYIGENLNKVLNIIRKFREDHAGMDPTSDELTQAILNSGLEPKAKSLAEVFGKLSASLTTLLDTTNETEEQIDYNTKEIARSAASDKYSEDIESMGKGDSKRESAVSYALGAMMEDNLSESFKNVGETIKRWKTEDGNSGISNANLEEGLNQFKGTKTLTRAFQATGLDPNNISLRDVDLGRLWKYVKGYSDEQLPDSEINPHAATDKHTFMLNGDEVTKQNSELREDIYRWIGQQAILEQAEIAPEDMGVFKNMLGKADALGEEYGVDFTSGLLNAITNGNTESFFQDAIAGLTKADTEELRGMSWEDLRDTLGLNDKILNQMGFTGKNAAEEFWNSFQDQLDHQDEFSLRAKVENMDTLVDSYEKASALEAGKKYKQEDIQFVEDAGLNLEDYFNYNAITKKWEATAAVLTMPDEIRKKIAEANDAQMELLKIEQQESLENLRINTTDDQALEESGMTDEEAIAYNRHLYRVSNNLDAVSLDARRLEGESDKDYNQRLAQEYADRYNIIKGYNDQIAELKNKKQEAGPGMLDHERGELSQQYDDAIAAAESERDMLISLGDSQHQVRMELASSAESIEDLNTMLEEGSITVEEFNANYDRLAKKEKSADLKASDIADYVKQLSKIPENASKSADELENMAIAILRAEKAIKEFKNSGAQWIKSVKESSENAIDYQQGMAGIRETAAAAMDILAEDIPENFFDKDHLENVELMQEFLNGDATAMDRLAENLNNMQWDEALANIKSWGLEAQTALNDALTGLLDGNTIDEKINTLKDKLNNIPVGTEIDDSALIEALNAMVEMGAISADQLADQFDITYEPETTSIPATDEAPPNAVDGWTPEEVSAPFQVYDSRARNTKPQTESRIVWTRKTSLEKGDSETHNTEITTAKATTKSGKTTGGKIKSIKRKNLPSSNVNAAGGAPKQSGGGGGGGGSSKKPKLKETDSKSRYHRIDKQAEKVKDEYDQLSKSRERAYGPAVLKYMDEESKKLEEQIALIKEKRTQAEAYLKEDLADLNKYAAEVGFTVTYDDAGIVNYEDLKKQADEYYNAHVTGDSDADEWLEKWYDHFTKMLDQYEETLKVVREQTNKEIEKIREKFDKELEKFQIQIDFNIEITDTLKKYWDYMDSRLENFIDTLEKIDQVTQIAQQRILLEQSSMNNTIKQTKDALVNLGGVEQEAVDKLFETLVNGGDWTSIYGDPSGETGLVGALTGKTDENGKALIEFLNEGIEKVYQAITDQVEQAKRPAEQMVASYDKIIEDQERLLSNFEEYSAEITMYIDIADALGQRMSGMTRETLNVAREAQISVMQDKIDALAAERDRLQNNVLKEYKAKLEEAESRQGKGTAAEQAAADADYKAYKEAIDNIEDAIKEKQSEWRDSITEMAQMLKDNFTSAIEGVVNAFDYAISDMYNSVEKLQEAYDQRRTLEEQYIPEYKQVYELNKISRDLSKQLDTTDSLVAQKKLRDFQKEIYDLQNSGKKLSEYDLEYLQKKYDLRVAEIALEDAQNAKNQVRLSRDAEGNYSYVYTANEESTGNAAADYEDKLYALQELSDNRSKDLGSDYLAAIAEMEDAFRSMSEQDFESREDYERTKQLILDNFKERVAFITSQNDQILQNNKELYEQDYLGYVDLIKNITSSNEAFQMKNSDFATEFSDTILGKVMPSYSSMKDHASSVIAAIEADQDGLIAQIDTAYESLQSGIADMYANLGTTWSEHMTSLEGDERLVAFLNGNVEKFNTYKIDASKELEGLADNASHEADRIISGFSGGESGEDAAFYLDAMEKSGTDAAAVFGTEGVFGKAASNLVKVLGKKGDTEGITPALLGGADSAGLLASSLSDVETNAPDTSSAIKTMVENVAGPEGNSGYLATLKTGVDGLTGKIVAAGSSVKTDFVDPTETQFGALSTWIQGTGADQGVGQISKAMGTYVGTINPTAFADKLTGVGKGSVLDKFNAFNTTMNSRSSDAPLMKWRTAVDSWKKLKGTDGVWMDTAINGKLQSVVQKFKDLGTNAKPGATYATDIAGWTTPIVDNVGNGTSDNKAWHKLRLLGNAFSNISKNAKDTKKSITDYNSVNPEDKKASTTITWIDNFSEWLNGKDGKSGFNKNLTDIDRKAADVSVTWKDNWDEFNKKLQEKINSVKEQSINVKLKVEDESGTASNVWSFNGKANSARSALQAIVGLKEASNEDLQAMDFDHNKSTSLLDAINWLRVSARLPAITSINNETDKGRLKSVLHLLEDALNQSETDIKDMQPEDIIKLIKELSEKAGIPYYDTGGYTGEWGDSGKLAMLHQKELVLNPVDTSNILAAVDLVRQAAQAIDLSARASQYAMGSNLAATTTASIVNSNDLNQNVTIYAEFPGVSVEAEIQNAFNAMEMQAIQYAHRDY